MQVHPPRPESRPEPGWVRVDCHLHTEASGDARTTLDELSERVREVGLDVVCITDHNVVSAALQAVERDIGARVIVGEEVRTSAGEVIGLFLRERIPYILPTHDAIARIRDQGGIVYVPHPFDTARPALRSDVLNDLCAAGLVDVLEVFNAKTAEASANAKAAAAARRLGLPAASGSDAHDPEGLGAAYIDMPDFDGPHDFVSKLPSARLYGEYRDHSSRYAPVARPT